MSSEAPLRLAIVASSGGSVFGELVELTQGLPISYCVVTDRSCGIESIAAHYAIPHRRIEEQDSRSFSDKAANALNEFGATSCLLFFARVITRELFERLPTFNPHPSLLPDFPGFYAVRRAREAHMTLLGASLHVVTAAVDNGPVVAQIATAVLPEWPEARWQKISFLQKVYLAAVLVELLLRGSVSLRLAARHSGLGASLPLTNQKIVERFRHLQARETEVVWQ